MDLLSLLALVIILFFPWTNEYFFYFELLGWKLVSEEDRQLFSSSLEIFLIFLLYSSITFIFSMHFFFTSLTFSSKSCRYSYWLVPPVSLPLLSALFYFYFPKVFSDFFLSEPTIEFFILLLQSPSEGMATGSTFSSRSIVLPLILCPFSPPLLLLSSSQTRSSYFFFSWRICCLSVVFMC